MNSKNIIIGVLFLTTVAGGIYGWTQHRQNTALNDQVATLTKDLKNATRPAQRRPARPAAEDTTTTQPAPDDTALARTGTDARAAQRAQWESFRQSPKGSQLMAAQQRDMLDRRYSTLFKTLNLTPDQLAKFKDLLVERQNAARDVMNVAREQGLDFRNSNDRSEIQQLVQQAQADVDTSIATAIGQDKYAQFQNYDQTAPQRIVVNQIAQSLSYTSNPLTPEQNDQLVALLAQNAPPNDTAGRQSTPITDDIINAAQSFLTPDQVDALRQQQSRQGNRQQLMQMWQQRRRQQQ